jgi:hypothetical protein
VKALLDGTWQDYGVRIFVDTYLRPLKRQVKAGKVEIERPGIPLGTLLWAGYQRALEADHPEVDDPTQYLDALLREVMETGNSQLTIPYKAALGFSNCGKGFYKEAKKAHGNPMLMGGFAFPAQFVSNGHWDQAPRNGSEQLLHFVWQLRHVMAYLATNPLGKRSAITPAMVAQMITTLPQRTAYVNAGGEVGPLFTHNTPPRLHGDAYRDRLRVVTAQTRQRYCHPKSEVERLFTVGMSDACDQETLPMPALVRGVHQAIQHTVSSPASRWAEVEEP